MTESETIIARFETRIRQLILRFQEMKKENDELYAMVDEQEQTISQLRAKLTQSESDYNSLKMAKMLEVSDGDIEQSKAKIAKLIRDVNRCITILKQ